MGEYFGWFIFLGIFLMAFWILLFLTGFLSIWATAGVLNSLFPKWFGKKDEAAATDGEA